MASQDAKYIVSSMSTVIVVPVDGEFAHTIPAVYTSKFINIRCQF
jgi:hypothetical protein